MRIWQTKECKEKRKEEKLEEKQKIRHTRKKLMSNLW